jgi:hypothetical protein
MWQFGNYDPIRGEANILAFVKSSKKVQDEIMQACFQHQDSSTVELDSDGVVVEECSAEDLDISL